MTAWPIGIPWLEFGRDRDGLDCWGAVRIVFKDHLGVDLPIYDTVEARARDATITDEAKREPWREIAPADRKPYDVAFYKSAVKVDGRWYSGVAHCAVIVDRNRVFHIKRGGSTCIQDFDDLEHRLAFILRHRSLA